MRPDTLYLRDKVEAADAVAGFTANASAEALAESDLLRSAVLHKLTVIGDAAARLSRELREQHPAVPWADISWRSAISPFTSNFLWIVTSCDLL